MAASPPQSSPSPSPSPISTQAPPSAEVLLQRIAELEANHDSLKSEISKLIDSNKPGVPKQEEVLDGQLQSQYPSLSGRRTQSLQTGSSFAGMSIPVLQNKASLGISSASSWPKSSESTEESPIISGAESQPHCTPTQETCPRVAPFPERLTERHYLNILQSMGQAIYIFNLSAEVIYWNRKAEVLYGYTEKEALGSNVLNLLVHEKHREVGMKIISRLMMGEHWNGQFPLLKKSGEIFPALISNSPFYDSGKLVGVIGVTNDSRPFSGPLAIEGTPISSGIQETGGANLKQLQSQAQTSTQTQSQVQQNPITSSLSSLASKVTSKVTSKVSSSKMFSLMRVGESNVEQEGGSGGSQCSEGGPAEVCGVDSRECSDRSSGGTSNAKASSQHSTGLPPSSVKHDDGGSPRARDKMAGGLQFLSSKAESWMAKKGFMKSDRDNGDQRKGQTRKWPLNGIVQSKSEAILSQQLAVEERLKAPIERGEGGSDQAEPDELVRISKVDAVEAPGSWNWASVSSTSSNGSTPSTNSSFLQKSEVEMDILDCEIEWESLTVSDQIGQGSSGTVYRGFWIGSDVAIKVFAEEEYPLDLLEDFRKEVVIMKRLRHPNILLFMGAVISPQRLAIVTEFLPRGSLFRLLHRNTPGLDIRRRVRMALDVARGMNYLHHLNPPIVHRDLKSSNLLVDRNWSVKVADFGLSRMKHDTYLKTMSGRGTPQWMAPEVLRNEPSNEKSDVYSYGVVLWELATEQVPWTNLNPMQVVGAVGFMGQQLDIPESADPNLAALVRDCCNSNPMFRPNFQEITDRLKELQRQLLRPEQ